MSVLLSCIYIFLSTVSMYTIPFSNLRFSHLFSEFIAGNPLLHSHFPAQNIQPADWRTIAESFNGRNELTSAIISTMDGLNLSQEQNENLQLLAKPKTMAVVTGQQVGFLGGALYTVLKAYSAVQSAKQISSEMSLPVVPIFWIEDNDADSAEAAKTTILSAQNELIPIACSEELTTTIPVAYHKFGDEIVGVLDNIEATFPKSEFSEGVMLQLREIYHSGAGWTSAFTKLLQLMLADSGILFISASLARENGLFSRIIRKEIEEFGGTKSIIDHTSTELEKAGFHIQAVASDVNLFFHYDGKRLKLRSDDGGNTYTAGEFHFSREQIIRCAEDNPEMFSPNVLLRPIIQDDIIPTIAYIGGPGEIAYLAQLHAAYKFFDVQMPMVKPRHSATFTPPSVVRFLEKNNFKPDFFMRSWQLIEKELVSRTADAGGEQLFISSTAKLKDVFASILQYASSIDQSLVGAVNAAQHHTEKQVEDLKKKINSSQKKRHDALFDKSYETTSILMPFGELQERNLSPISLLIRFGIGQLFGAIRMLSESTPNTHFIVPINFPHINQ